MSAVAIEPITIELRKTESGNPSVWLNGRQTTGVISVSHHYGVLSESLEIRCLMGDGTEIVPLGPVAGPTWPGWWQVMWEGVRVPATGFKVDGMGDVVELSFVLDLEPGRVDFRVTPISAQA